MATPVSLVEWFLNFYEEACQGDVRPVEGVVRAGEVLFVPRGWWHMAINLEVLFLCHLEYFMEPMLKVACLYHHGTPPADYSLGVFVVCSPWCTSQACGLFPFLSPAATCAVCTSWRPAGAHACLHAQTHHTAGLGVKTKMVPWFQITCAKQCKKAWHPRSTCALRP